MAFHFVSKRSKSSQTVPRSLKRLFKAENFPFETKISLVIIYSMMYNKDIVGKEVRYETEEMVED